MCGIAGIIRFDGRSAEREPLARMARLLAHRGPDGEGIHTAGAVGFAHLRLAIIDPNGGHQPLVDPASGMAITYNGEVYNYREIRGELGETDFTTESDTEVVLRAWRRWGPAALDRCRGMFAFALHDPRAGKVFVVRDRVGIKPLYYRAERNQLAFASELGALIAGCTDRPEIDPDALSLYLRYGYVPTPHSIYRDIKKLEPGCYLEIEVTSGRLAMRRYWRLSPEIRPRPESQALAELEALLLDTMQLYVRSDVPFGTFLSGGVDSSLVTALMSQVLDQPVRSFTIGFDDPTYSELPFAEEAARSLGTRQCSEVLAPELPEGLLSRLTARFGEPFADSSCLPTWQVSRLAASEVKMVLSGDGGDELFAGYRSYPAVAAELRRSVARPLYRGLAGIAHGTALGSAAARRARSWSHAHHAQRDTFTADEIHQLTGRMPPPADDENIDKPAELDPVTRCQLRDVGSYLLDDILTKVDRMSMDNSLEVRVPLLDHKLVEFAFSLPLELRLRRAGGDYIGKYLLKRAAERYFPRPFLDRPKWGFGIPAQAWLEGALRPLASQLLDVEAVRLAPLIDPGAAREVVREFYRGRPGLGGQVWNLLSLRLWQDGVAATGPAAKAA